MTRLMSLSCGCSGDDSGESRAPDAVVIPLFADDFGDGRGILPGFPKRQAQGLSEGVIIGGKEMAQGGVHKQGSGIENPRGYCI